MAWRVLAGVFDWWADEGIRDIGRERFHRRRGSDVSGTIGSPGTTDSLRFAFVAQRSPWRLAELYLRSPDDPPLAGCRLGRSSNGCVEGATGRATSGPVKRVVRGRRAESHARAGTPRNSRRQAVESALSCERRASGPGLVAASRVPFPRDRLLRSSVRRRPRRAQVVDRVHRRGTGCAALPQPTQRPRRRLIEVSRGFPLSRPCSRRRRRPGDAALASKEPRRSSKKGDDAVRRREERTSYEHAY